MENPFKAGSHNHRMLELYRENGYKLRASQTHHYCLSPTKVESNLRKEGFIIEVKENPGSRDNFHIMVYDPYNPEHSKLMNEYFAQLPGRGDKPKKKFPTINLLPPQQKLL